MLLHFECHAGLSGTPVFGIALATSQGTQAQQKTAGRRRFGDGAGGYGRSPVVYDVDVRVWWTADIKKGVGTRPITPEVKTN